MSRPISRATARASALPIGPCMLRSLLWNCQKRSPGNWLRAALATLAASTEPGPEHREILEDELEVGVVLHQARDIGQGALAEVAVVVEELDERRGSLGVADSRLKLRRKQLVGVSLTIFCRSASATCLSCLSSASIASRNTSGLLTR